MVRRTARACRVHFFGLLAVSAVPFLSVTAQAQVASVTMIENGFPSTYGDTVRFTATVFGLGAGAPTGDLTLKVNGTDKGVTGVTNIGVGQALAVGQNHTCALNASRRVYCWGRNAEGQLGDETYSDRNTPTPVANLDTDVIGISAGFGHTCAVTAAGGLKCWGDNSFGQLGIGSSGNTTNEPADVTGLTSNVLAVAAGGLHTCALTLGGGVRCWGRNATGALGNGDDLLENKATPVAVSGLNSGVKEIVAGYQFTCALKDNGGVMCWGADSSGQLGNGSGNAQTEQNKNIPVDVLTLSSGVTTIAAGLTHACAVTGTGTVKCWGANNRGQLGDSLASGSSSGVPVDVVNLPGGAVTLGLGESHTCAIDAAMTAKCWGTNLTRQLGDGTANGLSSTPVDVVNLGASVFAIKAGGFHTCALANGPNVKCWGTNASGQIGDGSNTDRPTATNAGTFAPTILGTATIPINDLPAGTHSITLVYSGDANYSPSTSGTLSAEIAQIETTIQQSSANSATVVYGEAVAVTVHVDSSFDAPTGDVEFSLDGTPIGTETLVSREATRSVSPPVGSHTLQARYLGDTNHAASVVPLEFSFDVVAANTTTAVTATPNALRPGQSVTLRATVTATAPATGVPTGSVTFMDGATPLGSAPINGTTGRAQLVAVLTSGTHTISSNYAGDSNYNASSGNRTVTVSGKVGAETRVNTKTANAQQMPAVARLMSGAAVAGYVVVWASDRQEGATAGYGIYGQRYNASGTKLPGEFHVNTVTAGDQTLPAVAGLNPGGFVAVWQSKNQDGSGFGIYGQRFSSAGGKMGAEFRANKTTAGNQSAPAVAALAGGGFVVAWQSDRQDGSGLGIYAQRFATNGAPVGSEIRVNTTVTNAQSAPAVAGLKNGSFVVAWQSDGQDGSGLGVYGQRFTGNGAKAGAEFKINKTTAAAQSLPAITALANGGFVAVWQSSLQDGSKFGVFGQRYSATAVKAGPEFQVNGTTANDQSLPSVSGFSDCCFVVSWMSKVQDGSGQGIYTQVYKDNGGRLDGEMRANTFVTGNQTQPAVAAMRNGSFVVVWTSPGLDNSFEGIFSQRFSVVFP